MSKSRGRSRSHNPLPRDEYRERDYRRQSRSRERYDHGQYQERERDYHYRSRSFSASPDHHKDHGKDIYDEKQHSPSRSYGSTSPAQHTPIPRRSPYPCRPPPSRGGSPDVQNHNEHSLSPRSVSPRDRRVDSQSSF